MVLGRVPVKTLGWIAVVMVVGWVLAKLVMNLDVQAIVKYFVHQGPRTKTAPSELVHATLVLAIVARRKLALAEHDNTGLLPVFVTLLELQGIAFEQFVEM